MAWERPVLEDRINPFFWEQKQMQHHRLKTSFRPAVEQVESRCLATTGVLPPFASTRLINHHIPQVECRNDDTPSSRS